jgi:hypothetical protein
MFDFLAAIGLFFAIEGILFAAFPLGTKRRWPQPSTCRTAACGSWALFRQSWASLSSGWYDIDRPASGRVASEWHRPGERFHGNSAGGERGGF